MMKFNSVPNSFQIFDVNFESLSDIIIFRHPLQPGNFPHECLCYGNCFSCRFYGNKAIKIA
jgi:hypothetical protein